MLKGLLKFLEHRRTSKIPVTIIHYSWHPQQGFDKMPFLTEATANTDQETWERTTLARVAPAASMGWGEGVHDSGWSFQQPFTSCLNLCMP